MEKDPNKEILDNIKKVKFYGVSSEEEMESYVKQKNQQQRADGVVDKDNFHSINLKEKPDDETKKARLKINAWAIAIIVAIVVIAILACMKIAS
ncbi:hypothetical protein [Emergencia timonensis]|uniref:hypothetical protein n=1 Tax=Emergencia timonensis TaxID=1776384 RepID=UPI003991CA8B